MRGDLGPQVSSLLGNWASNAGTLHLALGVYDDSRVVLEVDDGAILAAPALALTDDDGVEDLLAELWLALLDGGHDHVAECGSRKSVKTTVAALHGNDVEVLRASVVGAVDDGTDGQCERDAEAAALDVGLILTHCGP